MKLLDLIKNKNGSRKISVITGILSSYANLLISIVNGLVLIPFYLKFFDSTLYGAWIATAGMVSMFALLEGGVNQIITQKLAKSYARKSSSSFKLIFSTGILINIVVFITIILIGFILSKIFPNVINIPKENHNILSKAIILATLGSAFTVFQGVLFSPFYAWQKVFVVAIVAMATSISAILVNIICLYSGLGVLSLSVSILFNGFSGFCLSLILVKKQMDLRYGKQWLIIHKGHILVILKKSLPLYLNKIFTTVANNIEPILIAYFVNPTAVVVYTMTSKLLSVASSLINPIAGSIIGSASHLFSESNNEKKDNVVKTIVTIQAFITITILTLVVTLNKDFIDLWLGEKFYGGELLTFLFALQILVQTRLNLFSSLIQSTGDFKTTSIYDIFANGSRILISLLILKYLAISFLPLASIVSIFLLAFIYYPHKLGQSLKQKNIKYYGLNFILMGFFLNVIFINSNLILDIVLVHLPFTFNTMTHYLPSSFVNLVAYLPSTFSNGSVLILKAIIVFLTNMILFYLFSRKFRTRLNQLIKPNVEF